MNVYEYVRLVMEPFGTSEPCEVNSVSTENKGTSQDLWQRRSTYF